MNESELDRNSSPLVTLGKKFNPHDDSNFVSPILAVKNIWASISNDSFFFYLYIAVGIEIR